MYDLIVAVCKNEGVDSFEALGLGPFYQHPLVKHYFSAHSQVTEVFEITSAKIVQLLIEFEASKSKDIIRVEEFLDFIANKLSVKCRELLGIRIRNFGMLTSVIREARISEESTLERFMGHSQIANSNNKKGFNGPRRRKGKFTSAKSAPSKLLKRDNIEVSAAPMKNDSPTELKSNTDEDLSIDNDSLQMFAATWKEPCREHKVAEVLERMLECVQPGQRNTIRIVFSTYPFIGLLNAAVSSIKSGTWNSICDTFEAIGHNESQSSEFETKDVWPKYDSLDKSHSGSSAFRMHGQLQTGTFDGAQALATGKLGEYLACQYFVEKVGKLAVKWVNEFHETGLPYDIVIEKEAVREFIEVKATRSPRKDWFNISLREWQFAIENGESFSIAFVVINGNNVGRVTIFRDPVKLCQQGELKLAVMMPRQ